MAIVAKNEGGNFELAPSGNHVARCYQMIELGNIWNERFNKLNHKVRISFELPNERKVFIEEKGEQPFTISKEYTLSMNEKANLRRDLESWRGKGFSEEQAKAFDITNLLGVPCLLNVIHKKSNNGNEYAVISSISPLPKGMDCPPQENPTFVFSWDEYDEAKFEALPDWLKDKLKESNEYAQLKNPNDKDLSRSDVGSEDEEDDLPF